MKLELHLPYEDKDDINYTQLVEVLDTIAEIEGLRVRKESGRPVNLEVTLVVITPEARPVGMRTEMASRNWKITVEVYKPYDGGPVYAGQDPFYVH